jgi:hypothetical protein
LPSWLSNRRWLWPHTVRQARQRADVDFVPLSPQSSSASPVPGRRESACGHVVSGRSHRNWYWRWRSCRNCDKRGTRSTCSAGRNAITTLIVRQLDDICRDPPRLILGEQLGGRLAITSRRAEPQQYDGWKNRKYTNLALLALRGFGWRSQNQCPVGSSIT